MEIGDRVRALEYLSTCALWPDARAVEAAVYNACFMDKNKYKDKVLQLAANLKLRGDEMLRQYDMHALPYLSNEELARGTVVEQWWQGHNERLEQQRQMLSEEKKFEEGEQINFGSLICNRCHSRSISVQQQQIRSADEGMTVFCTCNKCNLRWRM